ncbi:6-pyruvoyl tetrahydropterin synthase [Candidatus Methanomethylophilus sp. 1R26]|uniref:6-pyruvoyl trahydropterin synthase family protein n=1 Tax=Candidatus Methanomethylophilus sp. 1R26 TaxID=1769296 RepID=UPI0007375E01|nr:6-pyruvoyl tetrahydropterin synthase family protein [Candidatus Methanomethylophilus sp. 1R26]KUE73218.1 6-pyruvoyl tetrahydropterin synthase [Candidatus Methanomethylophilus sp. 1R26]
MSSIEIDGGYSGIRFSACHFISRHEKCSRLHGHSYIVHLRLEGDIDENGMVMDFVILKKKLKEMVDAMDHAVLLPAQSKEVHITEDGEDVHVECNGKRYMFPKMDVRMLPVPTTTAEEMSKMMAEKMVREIQIPANIRSLAVGLDEERGQTAWYEVRF